MVSTGIYKKPVDGRVRVRILGLEGDEQADLRAHGGPKKAVYAYPSEHYPLWRGEFPDRELPWGFFGENLTTKGLKEKDVHMGDRFRIGTAILEVTKPRFPCFKLGIKFGGEEILDRFLRSGRSGFYLGVLEEGEVAAGDSIQSLTSENSLPTIAELVQARVRGEDEEE
jgi:MOSC domain-containing protein YiiM